MSKSDPFMERQRARADERSRCKFCTAFDEMSAARRRSLVEAVDNPAIEAQTIVDVLAEWGFGTSKSTVLKHRKGSCLSFARRTAKVTA